MHIQCHKLHAIEIFTSIYVKSLQDSILFKNQIINKGVVRFDPWPVVALRRRK